MKRYKNEFNEITKQKYLSFVSSLYALIHKQYHPRLHIIKVFQRFSPLSSISSRLLAAISPQLVRQKKRLLSAQTWWELGTLKMSLSQYDYRQKWLDRVEMEMERRFFRLSFSFLLSLQSLSNEDEKEKKKCVRVFLYKCDCLFFRV